MLLASLLACSLFAPLPAAEHAPPCGDAHMQELSATYRTYRSMRQRDPDLHTPELSDWNGDMHRVMEKLGDGLAAQRASTVCAEALLGPPDETRSSGQRHRTVEVARGEQHLVYWWRGGHDYLYLVVRGERVTQARWWFAYE
jgi:hypothetical protein